jgi:hypothetical protein
LGGPAKTPILRLDGQPRKYKGIALKDGPRVPVITHSGRLEELPDSKDLTVKIVR